MRDQKRTARDAADYHRERLLAAQAMLGSRRAMRQLMLLRGERHVERKLKARRLPNNYFSYARTRRRAEDLKAEMAAARLRWDKARPNLGLDDEVVLDLSLWAVQRAELDKAPNRWPSDYEAPPRSSLRDISALIHAPRPGPSFGMLAAA